MTTQPVNPSGRVLGHAHEAEVEAMARVFCSRDDSMYHHDRTDDMPCSACSESATAALAAVETLIRDHGYCCAIGCSKPATTEQLCREATPRPMIAVVYEWVCDAHAKARTA